MRALAVAEDLIVIVSGIWQTTCTAVRHGGEGFVIDSPVLPDEIGALPGVCEQAGFPVNGLLATHGDWDHLLGRLAFPEASLAVGESTLARLSASLGEPQRSLRAFDDEHYIEGRAPLGLAGLQSLPTPGRLSLGGVDAGAGITTGEVELEVHPAEGHTVDGVAYWLGWLGVLVCGDYLSPVEIPMLSDGGSIGAYVATLERLSAFVFGEACVAVVPGHGRPMPAEEAKRVLTADVAYLEAMLSGAEVALPEARRSGRQREIHAANLRALAA